MTDSPVSMIERVARALAEQWNEPVWEGIDPGKRERFYGDAIAAIEAMREPTQAMLDTTKHPHCVETMDDIYEVWVNMIDEALRPPVSLPVPE